MLRRSMITGGLAGLLAALVTSTSAAAQRFAHPTRQRLYRKGTPVRMVGVNPPYNPIVIVGGIHLGDDRPVRYTVVRKADQFIDIRGPELLEPCEGTQYAEYLDIP